MARPMDAPAPHTPTKPDFSVRATAPELMDADSMPANTYAALIADLARVNTITRARPPTLAWLARATRGMTRFSLVDVGFGHGDMLRAIAHWAQRRGIEARQDRPTSERGRPRRARPHTACTRPGRRPVRR